MLQGRLIQAAFVFAALGCRWLKADLRAKGYTQVVPRTIIEVDFIAHLEAQPEWAPEAFNTASRVKRKASVSTGDTTQRTFESCWDTFMGGTEVDEPNLAGGKYPEWTGCLKLGPE